MVAALEDAARGAAARPVPCASLVPANETCTCAAPMGSSSSLPADERWGLPSDGCPAAPYLVDEYPKRHAALIAEGRILIHCARSNNFGDYLQSVPSAVLMSVLADRALILECDVEGAAINVTLTSQKLHRYFMSLSASRARASRARCRGVCARADGGLTRAAMRAATAQVR